MRILIPAPESGEIDFANVNVRYAEEGDDAETLLFVGEEDDCELADDGGWYYDDEDDPEKIVLCPETMRARESEQQREDRGALRLQARGCASLAFGGPFEVDSARRMFESEESRYKLDLWDVLTFVRGRCHVDHVGCGYSHSTCRWSGFFRSASACFRCAYDEHWRLKQGALLCTMITSPRSADGRLLRRSSSGSDWCSPSLDLQWASSSAQPC